LIKKFDPHFFGCLKHRHTIKSIIRWKWIFSDIFNTFWTFFMRIFFIISLINAVKKWLLGGLGSIFCDLLDINFPDLLWRCYKHCDTSVKKPPSLLLRWENIFSNVFLLCRMSRSAMYNFENDEKWIFSVMKELLHGSETYLKHKNIQFCYYL